MSENKEFDESKRIRSAAYPSITLEQALLDIRKLRENLGIGPYSRDRAASGLGYTSLSGASARRVAALGHFGLLDKNGSVYKQSDLANRILFPTSDEVYKMALKEAFLSSVLYSSLISAYTGKSLPLKLGNILIHEYRINESVAEEVSVNFQKSAEFAGFLINGVIQEDANVSIPEERTGATKETQNNSSKENSKALLSSSKQFVFEFNGITLLIPQTKKTSEAIADGELKEARRTLTDFAKRFLEDNED